MNGVENTARTQEIVKVERFAGFLLVGITLLSVLWIFYDGNVGWFEINPNPNHVTLGSPENH